MYPKAEAAELTQKWPPSLFPQNLKKTKDDALFNNFYDMCRELHNNLHLLDIFRECLVR